MAVQKVACSDQSPGEPTAKRAKPVRVTETSTTVQSTMACSGEHQKIVKSPDAEISERNECVDEQHTEVIEALVKKALDPLEGTGCSNCTVLQNTVRKLRNRIRDFHTGRFGY